jgi:stress-induced-phosphoprotein 1
MKSKVVILHIRFISECKIIFIIQTGLEYDPKNQGLLQGQQEVKSALLSQLMKDVPMDVDAPNSPPPTASAKARQPSPPKHKAPPPQKKADEEDLPEHKREAKREKELGNESYKKKDFAKAIVHYSKAIQLDPVDITFYNNLAAVYFEQKDFKKCIGECEKAIEIGRENRADFKLIAKACTRIGNAYKKLEDYKSAKTYYEKSMSEHRTPEIKTLLSDVEKKIKEEELKAYIDPAKAEEEKEKGNEFFKKGDYTTALKHYSEAIQRNPEDPKLYSNRAACYTKLAAFDLGLKDCDMCCKLDEKFIKGWIRKGKILQGRWKTTISYQLTIRRRFTMTFFILKI